MTRLTVATIHQANEFYDVSDYHALVEKIANELQEALVAIRKAHCAECAEAIAITRMEDILTLEV